MLLKSNKTLKRTVSYLVYNKLLFYLTRIATDQANKNFLTFLSQILKLNLL